VETMIKNSQKWLKRSERSEETRRRIVEAAMRLFAQHGFDRTSTATIAKEADVSQGIIFHYFETKKKLFWTVVFEGVEEAGSRKEVLEEIANHANPLDKLRLFGRYMAQRAEDYPELNEILTRHVPAINIDSEVEAQWLLEKPNFLEDLFEEGKAKKVFREDLDTQIAAITFIGLFNANYRKFKILGGKGNLQETIQKAVEMLLTGIIA